MDDSTPSPQNLQKLQIEKIRLDGGTQPRAEINQAVVEEYADLYRAGVSMPPIEVFFDGVDYWLADGFHRWNAAQNAGLSTIEANVRPGTRDEARWFALSANQTHGLRRSSEDKERAVKSALKHPKGMGMSDSQIGEYLGISDKTVAKYRREMESTSEIPKSTAGAASRRMWRQ